MRKTLIKYIVDFGLLISFLGVTITGIIKFRSFLSMIGINLDYASMNMTAYRYVHDWSGLVMALFVLIHLILNWDWIIATTKHYFSKKEEVVEGIKNKK